jgi:hypothetical protein
MAKLFFEWYFWEVPQKIKKIWGNYLWFFSRYFAIPDLAREFFAPWKGLVFRREKRGIDFGDIFSAMFGNLISRIIGAIIRTFFLFVGIAVEILLFLPASRFKFFGGRRLCWCRHRLFSDFICFFIDL